MSARFDAADLGKLLLRLTVGGLMLLHGIGKIRHGTTGIEEDLASRGLPTGIAYGVYIGEVLAPVLLIAGFLTRPAALVLAFNMVVAILMKHAGDVLSFGGSGGYALELQMFYLVGGVIIALLGSGRYSVFGGKGRFD